ncbi:MAG: Rpn family recombination-promoting nuclease/putative transposase [Polyangiaceae bacterium]
MHDALFKAAFGQPDVARSELALVLPPDVLAHLDLATLAVAPGSFVDDDLRHAHTDLLYAVRTRDDRGALVYVLFEHQSTFDAHMPLRFLRYMVRIWDRWLRDHPPAVTLPLILPVLLHHGPEGWRAAPELATMFDASPALLEVTRPFQPHFRFLLDDLAALSLEELASRVVGSLTRLVRLALWSSRSLERVLGAAPLMGAIMATLGRDERTRELLEQLHLYLYETAPADVDMEQFQTMLFQMTGPQGREDVMNAGEQLRQEGREEALRGAIASVLMVRGLGCGEASKAKLAACKDVSLLTHWHTRAVTASSEAEVFADVGSDS